MVVVGLGFVAAGLWQCSQTLAFLARAVHAEGVIVDARQHPQVRFSTADGTPVLFVQNGFLSRELGAPVPVAYDPRDPAGTAVAATFWPVWWGPLGDLWIGLGFSLLPVFGFRASWNVGRSGPDG